MSNQLVIIGSGLAGYLLAKEWRKYDAQTPLTILTSSDGSFYSKPQLSTALNYKREANDLITASVEDMATQLNAEIRTHVTVDSIDTANQIITVAGENVSYNKLVLACGSQVKHIPFQGDQAAINDILSVNELGDYAIFRQRLSGKQAIAIIGSGLVGCEFANDLANAGFTVHVISPDDYPIPTLLPEQVSRTLQSALSAKGVQWHLSNTVKQINKTEDKYQISLSDDAELYVDLVLSAVGIIPNIKLAKEANIATNIGISVDRTLKTNAANVYALGDCAEVDGHVLCYVQPIRQCVTALAKTLTGDETQVEYPAMPVALKTPVCPIVVAVPPTGSKGEWCVHGEDTNLSAEFVDPNGTLKGFVLTGNCLRERMVLQKRLQPIFADREGVSA